MRELILANDVFSIPTSRMRDTQNWVAIASRSEKEELYGA